jgi:hypothetical protein
VKKVLYIISYVFPIIFHTRFLHQSFASHPFTTHIYPSHYTALSLLPYAALHYTSHHFTSLPITSLHFPSLHYTSHHFTTLPITSLHFPSLHYTFLHFLYSASLNILSLSRFGPCAEEISSLISTVHRNSFAVNTFRLHHKDPSVDCVWGNNLLFIGRIVPDISTLSQQNTEFFNGNGGGSVSTVHLCVVYGPQNKHRFCHIRY